MPQSSTSRVTDEAIIKLIKAGLKDAEIARQVKLSKSTICKRMKEDALRLKAAGIMPEARLLNKTTGKRLIVKKVGSDVIVCEAMDGREVTVNTDRYLTHPDEYEVLQPRSPVVTYNINDIKPVKSVEDISLEKESVPNNNLDSENYADSELGDGQDVPSLIEKQIMRAAQEKIEAVKQIKLFVVGAIDSGQLIKQEYIDRYNQIVNDLRIEKEE